MVCLPNFIYLSYEFHPFILQISYKFLLFIFQINYFRETPPDAKVRVLDWWQQHENIYPNLSRMASDYLAIPATSVPVERLFSEAGLLITERRNHLNVDTIRSCVCLDSWWCSDYFQFHLKFGIKSE